MLRKEFVKKYSNSRLSSSLTSMDLFHSDKIFAEQSAVNVIAKEMRLESSSRMGSKPSYSVINGAEQIPGVVDSYGVVEFMNDYHAVMNAEKEAVYDTVKKIMDEEGIQGKILSRINKEDFYKMRPNLIKVKADYQKAIFWSYMGDLVILVRGDAIYTIAE